jgi:parallel beta-helix repeat protein
MRIKSISPTGIGIFFYLAGIAVLSTTAALAGQGASRMLYTVPNLSFIVNPSGDSGVVTINDTSGSISTVQTSINNARTANPNSIIVIRLLTNATYTVSSAGLTLGSQECLIGTGATIKAVNSSVTVPLITISSGATNVSVAGGLLDGGSANIHGIYAPSSSARVDIDKATVQNCGQDCIQLNGNGSSTFNDEMTVARCDVSGSPGNSGISIGNATQATCVDNNCHGNSTGIWIGNCGYCNIANNTCENNATGINCNSGNDNYVVNNTCTGNGTGIYAGGSANMIVSDLFTSNSVAGISSAGSGNVYSDNLFGAGNATNFINGGSGDDIVAYKGTMNGSSQNYFYPPLADNQHTNTIVNGLGRYDFTDTSTGAIDGVQSEYNAAVGAHPGTVIVLHLNGNYTVGANPLTLGSDTCVLLGGTIQINSSTTAGAAIISSNASYVSISGGLIDGGTPGAPATGRNGIWFSHDSMFQIDAVTLQHFGTNSTRVTGSDVVRIDNGSTPRIVTRCNVKGGSARGIWVATSGARDIVSDNLVTGVQMDGVDCDSFTTASVVKFNTLTNNTRCGVFVEQSASYNLILGNVCNYDAGYAVECYNNSSTPRAATAYNSLVCNSIFGDSGLRNGSTGTNIVLTSDNFYFDNTVINAGIESQLYGAQNFYSQNYLAGGSISTSGAEVFFNPPDVTSNVFVQDNNSRLAVQAQGASTANGAAVVIGSTTGLGNDQWALVPTDSGYFQIKNKNSGLDLAVQGASTSAGAAIVQWSFGSAKNDQWMPVSAGNGLYNLINRLSGLYLDVPNAGSGTQLDQQPPNNGANQQFNLPLTLVTGSYSLSAGPASQAILPGGGTTFTASVTTNSGFSGSINFGLSGLPANATGNFSPTSLSGNGNSTLTITTATGVTPGNYSLSINGTNGTAVATATVNLIISAPGGSPGTLWWTNGAANLNWSSALNWLNVTSGGFGPPGISNDLIFTNISVAAASNTVNSIVDSTTAINSLTFNSTNGFDTVQVASGGTLTIAGSKGLLAGTESDLGTNATVYAAITGTNAALIVSNANAAVVVRQYTAGALGAPSRATLDLSGLDAFTMTGNAIGVGFFAGTGTARSAGTLSLARANTLNLTAPAKPGTTNAAIDIGDNPLSSSSQLSFLYLGQENTIYADGITAGGGRDIGWMGFNPNFPNSSAVMRGTNGSASRVSRWAAGDNSGSSATGSNSRGTNDFTGGSVDALVDTMILGRGESPTMGSGDSTGVVLFDAGTINLNTLQMGFQASGATGGLTSGTAGTNYFGQMDVDGSGTLVVNSNLQMTSVNTGTVGAMSLTAILNLNGGTVQATNIGGGSGDSVISLNSGTLNLQGGQITNITTLNVGVAGTPQPAQLLDAAAVNSPNVITIAANGTLAGNTIVTSPGLTVNGTISPGVNGIGVITNIGPATFGAGGTFAVAVENANGTPVAGWDYLQVNGALNLQASNANPFTIQVQSFDPNGSGSVTNFNNNTNYDWTIAGATGGIANFTASEFTVDTSLFQNDLAGGYFYVRTNGNSLVLSFTNNPPAVTPVTIHLALSGGNLVFSGSNGVAFHQYYVLDSTNLGLPIASWPVISTNTFDAGGNFNFTNPPGANAPQTFYILRLQ